MRMTLKTTAVIALGAVMALSLSWAGGAQTAGPATPGGERIEKAIQAVREISALTKPEERIPTWLFRKCAGIAVFPGVVRAAYGVGGQYGRGIVVARDDAGRWSLPAFATLVGGSIGLQIGIQKADIILVFRTAKSVASVVSGKLTLGADAAVAAGPVGRQAEASTDLAMEAEIYSYSKSKGLFAGISVKGAAVQIDGDAGCAFYGRETLSIGEIFAGRGLRVPAIADRLREALDRAAAARRP